MDIRSNIGRVTRRLEKLELDQVRDDARANQAAFQAAQATAQAGARERRFYALGGLGLTAANVLIAVLR